MSSITDNLNTSLSSLVSHFAAFLKNRDIQSLCLEKTVSSRLFSFSDSTLSLLDPDTYPDPYHFKIFKEILVRFSSLKLFNF
jgi:hypothetical protein